MTILKIESGNFATSLTTATLTQNRSITLPNASGELTLRSQLATVATSGSYNDLSNKPYIPPSQNGYVTQTWRSGNNWYRVWSDGWIEQGGYTKKTGQQTTITYSISFTDIKSLCTLATFYIPSNRGYMTEPVITSRSITKFVIECNENIHDSICWFACGY